jgi:hypothetical protein
MVKAARGKHIGKRLDKPAENEAEHFLACPNCCTPIDLRDLGQVLEHIACGSILSVYGKREADRHQSACLQKAPDDN